MSTKPDEKKFDAKVAKVAAFKRCFGHCNVPKNWPKDPVLGRWVRTQRDLYARGGYDAQRRAKLESIGFEFDGGIRNSSADIERRLATLSEYRLKSGSVGFPSRSDPNPDYAALVQWIERMRRNFRGGVLSSQAISMMTAHGICLQQDDSKVSRASKLANESFAENFEILARWIDDNEATTGNRDIAYRDSQLSEDARKAYRFLEHCVLKARQESLPDEQRAQLLTLSFTINKTPIEDKLNPGPSIRSPEGGKMSRVQQVLSHAEAEINRINADLAQTIREARIAKAEAETARDSAQEVHRQVLAEVRSALRSVTEVQALSAGSQEEVDYLTTQEVAVKLRYDARTVRERLVPTVMIEGRHYIRSLGGRRYLFIWKNIQADMRSGAFDLLERHAN